MEKEEGEHFGSESKKQLWLALVVCKSHCCSYSEKACPLL